MLWNQLTHISLKGQVLFSTEIQFGIAQMTAVQQISAAPSLAELEAGELFFAGVAQSPLTFLACQIFSPSYLRALLLCSLHRRVQTPQSCCPSFCTSSEKQQGWGEPWAAGPAHQLQQHEEMCCTQGCWQGCHWGRWEQALKHCEALRFLKSCSLFIHLCSAHYFLIIFLPPHLPGCSLSKLESGFPCRLTALYRSHQQLHLLFFPHYSILA